jgi:signal transduction histidine kinase
MANLIHNAVKFTPRDGNISVTIGDEDGQIALRVRDSGVGISPSMLEHIFEPFAQIEPAGERTHGGLGLGLSLVKQFTELHGGVVSVSSPGAGQGSEFVMRLPRISGTDRN